MFEVDKMLENAWHLMCKRIYRGKELKKEFENIVNLNGVLLCFVRKEISDEAKAKSHFSVQYFRNSSLTKRTV